jgi:Uma2 family endonuclease
MNATSGPPRLTRAADGAARRGFSLAEVEAMTAAGILDPGERFELIDGDIVPMQAKSNAHEKIKTTLVLALAKSLPETLWLGVGSTIRLAPNILVEPDICLYPRGLTLEDVRGTDLVAVIEIGDASLGYDRGLKRRLYAEHGVKLYWSIDAVKRTTLVLAEPRPNGDWGVATELGAEASLVLRAIPNFAVRLAEATAGA